MEREIRRKFSEGTDVSIDRKEEAPARPPLILPEDELRKLQALQKLLTIYE